MLANNSVYKIEQAPQNDCHQCLCPQGECQLPPASLGDSSRSAGGSDPGSFQITVSALVSGVCEILCVPLRVESLFPTALGSPEGKPCWPSKPNVLVARLPSAGCQGWGAPCGVQTPCSLGRISAVVILLLYVGCPPGGLGLEYTATLPLLLILLWFFLYIFSCRSFLVDS